MNCFLSSVATNGYDERGFKIENVGPTSSIFNTMPAKITKQKFKNSRVVLPGENLLMFFFFHNSTGSIFFIGEGAKSNNFSSELTRKQQGTIFLSWCLC